MDRDSQEPGVDFDAVEESIIEDSLVVDAEYWCRGLGSYVVFSGFYFFDNENEELYLLFYYYRRIQVSKGEEYGIWIKESEVDL